ncbi:MAG: sugar-binding protein [Verrucomicrobiota bacterium]
MIVRDYAVGIFLLFASSLMGALEPSPFTSNFKGEQQIPSGWRTEGAVTIDSVETFRAGGSIRIERQEGASEKPASVTSPLIAVRQGVWDAGIAFKSDLLSPDASYSGVIALETLNDAGQVVGSFTLADTYGRHNWQPVRRRVEIPAGVVSARLHIQLNKASGRFWVDAFSLAFAAEASKQERRIKRLLFSTAQLGNLLLPGDSRKISVTVEADKPLERSQTTLTYGVRDYWGAEQTESRSLSLLLPEQSGNTLIYRGSIDLDRAPLEVGRYYEIHAEIPQAGSEPFRAYTSLAILPEAEAKRYKPEEIPFTSRSWNNTIPETVTLTDRLGIRIAGIWGGWSSEPPYKPQAPCIELVEQLKMGFLTNTPILSIEARYSGYEKFDEKALREGMRNFLKKYAHIRPLYINLGNEPHGTGDRIIENVRNYRILYEEVKKFDPSIFVIGSSMGPEEEYFKAGAGKYCDAYDFHIYEDSENVRAAIRKYHELFKKYGNAKPIWSTELGLNSHGMTRHAVAVELIKKFVVFFAEGGSNLSWFSVLFPDTDGSITGSSSDAHNVFDGRYGRFSPRLDAIAYYNAVNGIAVKKFLQEKKYDGAVSAFLFEDRDKNKLQVLWKEKGRRDVYVPLQGVGKVQVIRIDGSRSELEAGGQGVTLSITEDPLLLLYREGEGALADNLDEPFVRLISAPSAIVRGTEGRMSLALGKDVNAGEVDLVCPPSCSVKKSSSDLGEVVFEINVPEHSFAREIDCKVTIASAGKKRIGELYYRIPVTGRLAMHILPVPSAGTNSPLIKLQLANNGDKDLEADWDIAIVGQLTLSAGEFSAPEPADAYFADSPQGHVSLAGGQTSEVTIPLAGTDPLALYRIRAQLTEPSGARIIQERLMGGFVGVPRVKGAIKTDGILDEADWGNSPALPINLKQQFYVVMPAAHPWKGPEDISGTLRFLWDDHFLYAAIEVTDDIAGKIQPDDSLWAGDGLQFLIDPMRESSEKVGKYDYSIGIGKNGPAAWCNLSADSGAPTGKVQDMLIGAKRSSKGAGSVTYELAIPWSRVAPFKPAPGADLGFTMVLNEDDGNGRFSFMTWFGNAHTKQVDTVGDLILLP